MIVLRCIDVLLLAHYILFLYLILLVSLRTNELIEVKEIPVTDKVHELGQTDGTSIGGARRLRNRDLELCSPRGFGGMEYHAWLPERRPLLLGELEIVRSSRHASCSLLVLIRFFLVFSSIPSCQSILSRYSLSCTYSPLVSASAHSYRLESLFFRISREKCYLTYYCPYPECRGKNTAESNRFRA